MSTPANSPKVALVTGAGRGIGKAIAEILAKRGHTVICVSKNLGSCGPVAEAINAAGGKAEAFAVDVADAPAVKALCESILKKYECVDIIVNNAGITKDGLVAMMSEDDFDSVVKANLSGCFYFIKHLYRPMTRKRAGRIINISSVVGKIGNPGQANYCSAKAGVHGLTMSLARELASRNITVNAVAPGFITTDMTEKLNAEQKAAVAKQIPLQRMGTVDDIASMVDFLASDAAGYITGQVFSVDGGMSM